LQGKRKNAPHLFALSVYPIVVMLLNRNHHNTIHDPI